MLGTIETVQDSGVILISPDDRDAGRRSFDDAIWRVLAWIVLAAPGALRAERPEELTAELHALFPALCLTYSSTAVQAALSCSHQHVARLVRAGHLDMTQPGHTGRAGVITRKSCIAWLSSRRVR